MVSEVLARFGWPIPGGSLMQIKFRADGHGTIVFKRQWCRLEPLMKILLAADNSKCAMRAVRHVVKNLDKLGGEPEIHLLHVRSPLPGSARQVLAKCDAPALIIR
jgi:hypothetical protein